VFCIIPEAPEIEEQGVRAIAFGKGINLGMMGVFCLLVGLPDKGFSRPLGANKGILAAHEIEIGDKQQAVVSLLRKKWNGDEMNLSRLPAFSRWLAEMGRKGIVWLSGRDEAEGRA